MNWYTVPAKSFVANYPTLTWLIKKKKASEHLVCHGARPGTARRSDVATIITTSPSRGLASNGKNRWVQVSCQTGGRQSVSTDQTQAAEASFGEVERRLSGGKGAGACEGGGALPIRCGGAHLGLL